MTSEAQANLARRTAEEVQRHLATFRTAQEAQIEGMRMLKEQLQLFACPVPPPPDYTQRLSKG